MPRPTKGARLYLRRDRGIYVIRDSGRPDRSTGTGDRRAAEAALARYIAGRDRPAGPATAETMSIGRALAIYGAEHAPHTRDPARIGYAIAALDAFWGDLPVAAISRATCRRYAASRVKPGRKSPVTGEAGAPVPITAGTIRRELGALRAALAYCIAEGYLTGAPPVLLPPKPEPKDRWLTRSEAARLLWAAWRNPTARHLARFILVAIYTGTRRSRILRLRFTPSLDAGWVDVEAGLLYRRGRGEEATKKKAPAARIPRQLLAHLRRWHRAGALHVVEIDGQRVGSIKTAWATALRQAGIEHASPHTLRHTAITWAMQNGAELADAAGYFGVSMATLERVYFHHHPDHQKSAVAAMERRGA